MNNYSNVLQEGQRLWYDDRPATLYSKRLNYPDRDIYGYSAYGSGYSLTYIVRFGDAEGGSVTLTDSHERTLYESIAYYEHSRFEIGDTLEIRRDGLEPNLRGTLLEIDEDAERWGYRVGEEGGNSVWFSFAELSKVHSVISRERSPRALEVLRKTIAEKREELEALETALEVLEYATT